MENGRFGQTSVQAYAPVYLAFSNYEPHQAVRSEPIASIDDETNTAARLCMEQSGLCGTVLERIVLIRPIRELRRTPCIPTVER